MDHDPIGSPVGDRGDPLPALRVELDQLDGALDLPTPARGVPGGLALGAGAGPARRVGRARRGGGQPVSGGSIRVANDVVEDLLDDPADRRPGTP